MKKQKQIERINGNDREDDIMQLNDWLIKTVFLLHISL